MITSEVLIAYTQCKLKAHLLLHTKTKSTSNKYISMLEAQAEGNRLKYLRKIQREIPESELYSSGSMKKGIPILFKCNFTFDSLKGYADAIIRIDKNSYKKTNTYIPVIVVGTHKISNEQRLQLAFVGYVLSKLQKEKPKSGIIVGCRDYAHKIKIDTFYKEIRTVLKKLNIWIQDLKKDLPNLALNKNCPYCYFQKDCEAKALEKDDLSLLGGVTPKVLEKYRKKGIFTVNQLSYLFRPRKQRKGKKAQLRFRPELQALAIRTKKIYIQDVDRLPKYETEFFLDIEGIPDQDFYYLIGITVSRNKDIFYYSFWADSIEDEQKILNEFIEKIKEYPEAPIYHYGSYDSKAIKRLCNRYGKDSMSIEKRFVNVNFLIYGKIYFPVRSNALKVLGKYLGATWTYPNASGLQSIVWRNLWEKDLNDKYRQRLITYNEEDCNCLKLLKTKLAKIFETADSQQSVDFVNQPKKHTTAIGCQIHEELEQLLRYAHFNYDKNKISLKFGKKSEDIKKKKCGGQKGHQGVRRRLPSKCGTIVQVKARRGKCPNAKKNCKWLKKSDVISEKIIIDLHFTKTGCRKRIIKYVGNKAYCSNCASYFLPPEIAKYNNQVFGHSFQSWVIYQRIALREPYNKIVQVIQDLFGESISTGTLPKFIRCFGRDYLITEKTLISRLLKSPFLHVDETTISVQGEKHYIWVFTDGKHVVFRKTETREASIVHEFLSDYSGVLISDFYPGYDAVKCRQQKCWSHLIRNLNDDLWKEPFNEEFELFVWEVKTLIIPILQTIKKYGSKKRHLNKFGNSIKCFYKKIIDNQSYKFDVTVKYQKRFHRYRGSIFTFLNEDYIPWNNNTAERAIRHLAVQRKISGTFYDSLLSQYLLLLGIAQSCRFQDKPFLKFLLSEEKDVDSFKISKPKKQTIVGRSKST